MPETCSQKKKEGPFRVPETIPRGERDACAHRGDGSSVSSPVRYSRYPWTDMKEVFMHARTHRRRLLIVFLPVFLTFLTVGAVSALACPCWGCKMYITRRVYDELLWCADVVCDPVQNPQGCGWHSSASGKDQQCRCGGQGGTRDNCTCRATIHWDDSQEPAVYTVSCERNGCPASCLDNTGPGLPVGATKEVCECPSP